MNSLYSDHFRIQCKRTDEALSACGFDALAIYAGGLHMQFLDDQPYPFKANPHFKVWTPLQDAPDCWIVYRPAKTPLLVFMHGKHINWQRVERFKPYGGIRIEDNVACTHGAPENLTRPAFDAVG